MKTSLKGILAIINEEALVLSTDTAAAGVTSTALLDETLFEASHLTPSDSHQHAGR